jgi:hypothetical protein
MEFFKYSLFSFTIFFDLEEIILQNFNISKKNIINVELAKVLWYFHFYRAFFIFLFLLYFGNPFVFPIFMLVTYVHNNKLTKF